MNYNLIVLTEAKIDIVENFRWYKNIDIALAKRFLNSVKGSIKSIKSNPYQFQVRYDKTRVVLIETFPFLIHFNIEENDIIIKAIFHTSRDRSIWKNRI